MAGRAGRTVRIEGRFLESPAVHASFVAHLRCPLCPWAAVSSAPTYARAQALVSALVLEHVARQHAAVAADNESPAAPLPVPAS